MEASLASAEHGFEFEVEILATCIARGWPVAWVPIRTIYTGGPSHIRPAAHVRHFFRAVTAARRTVREAQTPARLTSAGAVARRAPRASQPRKATRRRSCRSASRCARTTSDPSASTVAVARRAGPGRRPGAHAAGQLRAVGARRGQGDGEREPQQRLPTVRGSLRDDPGHGHPAPEERARAGQVARRDRPPDLRASHRVAARSNGGTTTTANPGSRRAARASSGVPRRSWPKAASGVMRNPASPVRARMLATNAS